MNDNRAGYAARQAKLAQMRGRRALFALLARSSAPPKESRPSHQELHEGRDDPPSGPPNPDGPRGLPRNKVF